MQAFWVRVKQSYRQGGTAPGSWNGGPYNLTFNYSSMQIPGNSALRAPKQNQDAEPRQAVRLWVTDGKFRDQTLLVFKPSGTMNENEGDIAKLADDVSFIPTLFTVKGSLEYAISKYPSLTADASYKVGFRVGKTGTYTINASELANIPKNINVYLYDKNTKERTDLTAGESYTFVSDSVNTINRFELQFVSRSTGFDRTEAGNTLTYVDGSGHIAVIGVTNSRIQIYDALGRLITDSRSDSDRWAYEQPLMTGVYLVKITDERRNVHTDRVVIK